MIVLSRACLGTYWSTAVAGLLIGALSACSSHRSGDTVIRYWAMGREGEVVGELIREFERTHPGIRVDLQQLPWTAAHEKLLTAFAGDSLPDLCQLGNTWVPEFAALDALEPLAPFVEHSAVVDASDYFPGVWDTNVIDSKLLGIPWYVDTRLLFYRKDLLAAAGFPKPPQTWAHWRDAMAAVKSNASGDRFSIILPLNEFEPLLQLAIQQPQDLLRDNGSRANFDNPGFRSALSLYVEMFTKHWAPPMSDTQISNVWDEFGNGYFAFYISGPWNIEEFKRRLPERLKDAWGTAPLPGPQGVAGGGVAGGTSLVIFRSSKNKPAAWQLAEYFSTPAVQLKLHALTGDLPPRRSAWNDSRLASDPYAAAFRKQLESARATPKVPEWERIATEMQLIAERIVRGGMSMNDGIAELNRHVDALLEKRRWMLAQERSK